MLFYILLVIQIIACCFSAYAVIDIRIRIHREQKKSNEKFEKYCKNKTDDPDSESDIRND